MKRRTAKPRATKARAKKAEASKRRADLAVAAVCVFCVGWLACAAWYGVQDIPFVRASAQAGWHAAEAHRAELREHLAHDAALIRAEPIVERELAPIPIPSHRRKHSHRRVVSDSAARLLNAGVLAAIHPH